MRKCTLFFSLLFAAACFGPMSSNAAGNDKHSPQEIVKSLLAEYKKASPDIEFIYRTHAEIFSAGIKPKPEDLNKLLVGRVAEAPAYFEGVFLMGGPGKVPVTSFSTGGESTMWDTLSRKELLEFASAESDPPTSYQVVSDAKGISVTAVCETGRCSYAIYRKWHGYIVAQTGVLTHPKVGYAFFHRAAPAK